MSRNNLEFTTEKELDDNLEPCEKTIKVVKFSGDDVLRLTRKDMDKIYEYLETKEISILHGFEDINVFSIYSEW